MVFSSMTFLWAFLPILFLIYFLVKEKYTNYVLLLFSLLFYAWGEPKYIVLMLLSIIMNYSCGLLLSKLNKGRLRTIFFIFTIFINLGLLCYFKYFNFIASNINGLLGGNRIQLKEIILPIGISFYTFQIISYIVDLYREDIKVQKNIFNLALYISFFPQLIAGPIVKYHDIEKELQNRKITINQFAEGVRRFTYGLGKKVIFSNTLALFVDTIYQYDTSSLSFGLAWFGAIAYMLQIYFDFSGYSDMAIGLGKMFGFTFIENFNLPYLATSITDFWRRWHISLSTWFREYVYIPLGGNRKGKKRTYLNLWIVFLLTGLWHGASWNFIVWGLFHGFFIFIERIGLGKVLAKCKVFNRIYTLFVVLIGWVFFRANGFRDALFYLKAMFSFKTKTAINLATLFTNKFIIIFVLAILFAGIGQFLLNRLKFKEKIKRVYRNYVEPFVVVGVFGIVIMMLVSDTYNPFIYFRF